MVRPLTDEERENLKEFDSYALLIAVEALEQISILAADKKSGDLPTLRDQLLALHEHLFKITVVREDYLPRAESIAFLLREVQTAIGGIYTSVESIGAVLARLEDILPEDERSAFEQAH